MKTASPTLRDRALIVERQVENAADLTLAIKEAKDSTVYHTKAGTITEAEATSFILPDLPEDWFVTVDSHSSSPIFASENTQIVTYAHKTGIVDGEYAIDHLPLPDKEGAKIKLREKEQRQAKMLQGILKENPQVGEKILAKSLGGGRR